MKKILFFLFFTQSLIAQVTTLPNSIGIGTGINSSIPLHINKNGELARFQGTSPYISLFDGLNMNGYLQAINNTFEIGSKNNYDLNFFTGDAQRLKIFGDGTGITAYSRFNMGAGMNLVGAMRMAGNTGALGDVLMSLGNGTPVWSSVSQNPQVGFSAYLNTNKTLLNATEYVIDNFIEHFDDGGNFNPTNGQFTVPSAGLYQFLLNPLLSHGTVASGIPVTVRLQVNNNFRFQTSSLVDISSSYGNGLNSTFIVKLNQGDVVTFSLIQNSGSSQTLAAYSANLLFSGYKVY
ncbi:hypothetical protein [Emticicia sp. W12TSBA100-4]|uniref:C1q-like domain-containing protein n=1 Tax=Emticicia sp. W12TSBA100-4 TaxID=3160965 RepID=UPI003305DE2D